MLFLFLYRVFVFLKVPAESIEFIKGGIIELKVSRKKRIPRGENDESGNQLESTLHIGCEKKFAQLFKLTGVTHVFDVQY